MALQSSQTPHSNMQPPITNHGGHAVYVTYKKSFGTTLRSIVHMLIGFFRRVEEVNHDEEFRCITTTFRDAHSFLDALCLLYIEPVVPPIDMERWKAIAIKTYKDRAGEAKHEYIVIHFTDRNSDVYLKMQRGPRGQKFDSRNASSGSPANGVDKNIITGEQGSQKSSFSPRALDDLQIISPDNIPSCDVLVDHVEFLDDNHVPLPRIALLACTLNQHVNSRYHLVGKNCYWFAKSMVEVLKVLYPGHRVVKVPDGNLRGHWACFAVDGKTNRDKITEEFHRDWKAFKDKIDWRRGEDLRYANAQRELGEARRQLEEDRQKIEEMERQLRHFKMAEAMPAQAPGAGSHTNASH